jgi:hypothetical protein
MARLAAGTTLTGMRCCDSTPCCSPCDVLSNDMHSACTVLQARVSSTPRSASRPTHGSRRAPVARRAETTAPSSCSTRSPAARCAALSLPSQLEAYNDACIAHLGAWAWFAAKLLHHACRGTARQAAGSQPLLPTQRCVGRPGARHRRGQAGLALHRHRHEQPAGAPTPAPAMHITPAMHALSRRAYHTVHGLYRAMHARLHVAGGS